LNGQKEKTSPKKRRLAHIRALASITEQLSDKLDNSISNTDSNSSSSNSDTPSNSNINATQTKAKTKTKTNNSKKTPSTLGTNGKKVSKAVKKAKSKGSVYRSSFDNLNFFDRPRSPLFFSVYRENGDDRREEEETTTERAPKEDERSELLRAKSKESDGEDSLIVGEEGGGQDSMSISDIDESDVDSSDNSDMEYDRKGEEDLMEMIKRNAMVNKSNQDTTHPVYVRSSRIHEASKASGQEQSPIYCITFNFFDLQYRVRSDQTDIYHFLQSNK